MADVLFAEEAEVAGPSDFIMTRGNYDDEEEEEGLDGDTDDLDHAGERPHVDTRVLNVPGMSSAIIGSVSQQQRRARRATPLETSWLPERKWFRSGTGSVPSLTDANVVEPGPPVLLSDFDLRSVHHQVT